MRGFLARRARRIAVTVAPERRKKKFALWAFSNNLQQSRFLTKRRYPPGLLASASRAPGPFVSSPDFRLPLWHSNVCCVLAAGLMRRAGRQAPPRHGGNCPPRCSRRPYPGGPAPVPSPTADLRPLDAPASAPRIPATGAAAANYAATPPRPPPGKGTSPTIPSVLGPGRQRGVCSPFLNASTPTPILSQAISSR